MINVDDLLKPIAEGKPCGEDFTYQPAFQNLEMIVLGKPETQFGPGEDPDWKEVKEAAMQVLTQSKHLTAGVILTVSLLKLGGIEGARDGFAVIRGLVEKYWADVYPKLDPEDNNDPTQRLNILNNLSSTAKPYKFALHLGQAVICNSQSMGRITLQQYITAKEKSSGAAASGQSAPAGSGPDLSQIQAAFQEAGPAAASATLGFVNDLANHAKTIEKFIDTALGAGNGVNFQALNKLLLEMKKAVEPFAAAGAAPAAEAAPGDAAAAPAGTSAGTAAPPVVVKPPPGLSGTVENRADVVKAIGLICDYYRKFEPSSPVPFIIQRAQRLVDKDFTSILTDLMNPEAVKQFQIISGNKPENKQ